MFARMSARRWIILCLVVVFAGVNVWIFFFRAQESPWLGSANRIDLDSKESPFGPHDPRTIHWKEFTAVRALQAKADSDEPLTSAEVDQLIALTRHEYSLIQARALSGLASVTSPQDRAKAVDAMCVALESPNWLAVAYAANGLVKLDARDKAPLLLPLLEHPELDVRKTAQKSLDRLGYASKK